MPTSSLTGNMDFSQINFLYPESVTTFQGQLLIYHNLKGNVGKASEAKLALHLSLASLKVLIFRESHATKNLF